MKSTLILSLIASSLLAGTVETKEGTFLEVFSDNNAQSTIVASISADNGKIEDIKCRRNKDDELWCKISYNNKDIHLTGWSDKESLDKIISRPNKKPTFETNFGGGYSEVGNALLALNDGFLLVGATESFSYGQNDVYVVKTDKFGNKIWSASFGGRGDDIAYDVVEMKDRFVITGSTRSFGNKDQSVYVGSITKEGKLLWQNGYYSDKDDRYIGKSIAKVNSENVMIAGTEDHVMFFDSEVNCYLTAVGINGHEKWKRLYGGNKVEKANSIIRVADGYVFAGKTKTWGHGNSDAYVVKIDDSGKRVWHNALGYHEDEVANQVIATKDGGYLLVGSTNSSRRNLKDIYVAKLDKNGSLQWHQNYGSKEDDEGFGVVEADDGYVIVGYTKNTKNYKKSVDLLKLDKNGNIFWQKNFGSKYDKVGYAIVKVDDGYAITGYTKETHNQNKNLYLLKVDKDGNLE